MRKFNLKTLLTLAAFVTLATPVLAAYPDKPIKIIVGFTAGGTADRVGRILATTMGARMNQTMIVENRPGANGNLATDMVARSAPDGYTIFLTSVGHAVNPSLYKEANYDPVKDFTPIGQVLSAPNGLVVPGNSPFNTAKDLMTFAKSNPGKLNFASSGSGTSVHLSAEMFKVQAGVQIVHIPYKGTGSLMPDLLSGVVDLAFPNLPSALPHIKSGALKALGVTTSKRSAAAPQIPTLAEAGVPGYDMSTWYGLIGPANMPASVVSKLNHALREVLADPEVFNKLVAQGVDPVTGSPEEFGKFIKDESGNWARILKQVNLTIK
jgi:tripartite-type tricarboxylate transporter receptor subunit TctC